jgi:NAD(P)-dependent dehydrogenase (short-subunit alcohol dehydrogenase family)
MAEFDGRVALITGATGGIGRATALAFAREGARVVVAGRRQTAGDETVELIRALGGEARFVRTDVTVEAEVAALVHAAVETYGRLDCAFNNAGAIGLGPITEATEAEYRSIVGTNVEGVFLCLKHELAHMRDAGRGAIVNASSLAGTVGRAERGLYSASKHAVIGLTRSAALEVAREGIRVNAVCPGAIEGAMDELFKHHFQLSREQLAASVPVGRQGTPEEVADAVLFLCSDRAAFITGAALAVDGGMSAG